MARYRLRRMTLQQIADRLAEDGVINPKTKKAYTEATMCNDLQAIDAEWMAQSLEYHGKLKARQLADLEDIIREAWASKVITRIGAVVARPDLRTILAALKQKADLFGLDAPKKIAPTDPTGRNEYSGLGSDALRGELVKTILSALAEDSSEAPNKA